MRIDAHQHFWHFDPEEYEWIDDRKAAIRRDFGPEELKPLLEARGLDGSVAVQARQSVEETEALLRIADEHDFVRGVVGWVDLASEDAPAQLKRFKAHPRFKGVRHVAQDEPDDRFLVRPDFVRGIALLEDFDLAYDILIFPRQLPAAVELVGKFPRHRFVLDHIAKPPIASHALEPWAAQVWMLAEHDNVYCKLSGMVTEASWEDWLPEHFHPYLEVVFDAFSPERLMIGSDWPVCTLAGRYERVMDIVLDYIAERPEAEKDAILGGNAAEFYKLEDA